MNTRRTRVKLQSRERRGRPPRAELELKSFHREHMRSLARNGKAGFTLIEVLVVIGIIAILAAVVLVAVNPTRQFKLARDSQRTSNVNAILNAVHQNMAEHRGVLYCDGSAAAIPDVATVIAASTAADLASCLVPDYISALPFDPSLETAYYASTTDYNTGYEIFRDGSGRITASSTGEMTPTISVTR